MLGLLYIRRLSQTSPKYLKTVSSRELFLIAMVNMSLCSPLILPLHSSTHYMSFSTSLLSSPLSPPPRPLSLLPSSSLPLLLSSPPLLPPISPLSLSLSFLPYQVHNIPPHCNWNGLGMQHIQCLGALYILVTIANSVVLPAALVVWTNWSS